MNKKKLLAFALSLVMIAGSFAACGNSATPGKNNDKELEEAPESLAILSNEEKTTVADVTAITAGVDNSGKVVDKEGIVFTEGHIGQQFVLVLKVLFLLGKERHLHIFGAEENTECII